jgi:hypothetical protein
MTKLNQKGMAALEIILLVVVILLVAGVGYYVWYSHNKTNNTLNGFNNSGPTKTTKTTPTPSATATPTPATSELAALKTFCESSQYVTYVQNPDGRFGKCTVDGGMKISVYTNGQWTKVWSGNGVMDSSLCTQYKLPKTVYEDCSGYYQ